MKTDTTSTTSTSSDSLSSSSFGGRLRTLRKKNGLTQEELAEAIKVSVKTVQRWEYEQRQPRIEDVQKLAEALHVTDQELLSNEASSTSKGWVLTVKISHEFSEEVIDLGKHIPRKSTIITTNEGGYLCLGGDYSLWNDDNNFKQFIKDLKKFRNTVIQNGIALGGIKA